MGTPRPLTPEERAKQLRDALRRTHAQDPRYATIMNEYREVSAMANRRNDVDPVHAIMAKCPVARGEV